MRLGYSFLLLFLFNSYLLTANYQEELLTQLIMAEEGDVIEIPEGFHEINVQLSLTVSRVTIKGQGKHKSVLSFKQQKSGAEGLYISANNIILEGFSILDTKGDAIKISNSSNLIMRNLKVGWTGEVSSQNGGYGLYPVMSENILIEDCEAFGASDAGIYVGQSNNIIVRNNYVYKNVAGIEIENCNHADVYQNIAERNTAGILVFNLPNLSQYGSHVRVFNNTVYDNNLRNFAEPTNIVGYVPQGTGLMVMAYSFVEIFQNKVAAHDTSNLLLVSFNLTGKPINDTKYRSYVKQIYVHDNSFSLAGRNPKGGSSAYSKEQMKALKYLVEGQLSDILYDGFAESEERNNAQKVCLKPGRKDTFIYLDFSFEFSNWSRDITSYICSLEPLRPVILPLWFHNREA